MTTLNAPARSLPRAGAAPLKHLTTRHMERAFGVTVMTLYLWRKGTVTIKPLPVVDPSSRRVSYSVKAVERWAKANGMTVLVSDLAALLDDDALKPRQDGRPVRARVLVNTKKTKPASKTEPEVVVAAVSAKPSKREQVKRKH